MRGFFPFDFAQGQNDKPKQKQIPCGNDKQKVSHPFRKERGMDGAPEIPP
jgi:hypothetical protein